MSEINCYIPIKLRITGRPSDSQLDQLGDALVRALTARMEFAERVIKDGHYFKAAGAADLRELYMSDRYHPERATYTIPSYDGGGAPKEAPVMNSPVPADGAAVALSQAADGLTRDGIIQMISKRFTATNGLPDSSGVRRGVYLTMRGTNMPQIYYLVQGANGPELRAIFMVRRLLDQPDAPLDLPGGSYTLMLRPHGPGQLYRDSKHIANHANPENLDVAVNFFVPDAPGHLLEVTVSGPRRFHLYPRLRVVRANDESRLMTGAETVYLADVEIWRVDENDNWTQVWGLALIYASISYEWKIWRVNRTRDGGAEQRALVRQTKTDHPFLTHKWESDGEYEIECSIAAHYEDTSPRPVTEKRRDVVISLEMKMALDLAQFLKQDSRPGAEGVWPKSAWALLEAARVRLREAEGDPKVNQAIIDSLREAVKKLEHKIVNQTAQGPFPLRAIFTDFRTGQTRPLSLFIGPALTTEEGHTHTWKLIDLTYQGSYGPYTGNGQTVNEAIRAAFEDMRTSFRSLYPPGRILARVEWPGMSNYGLSPFEFPIETESWQHTTFQVGGQIAGGLGTLGLVAGMVFPGTWFVTTIVITSAVGGAAISAINIAERINTNSFEWDRETAMDLVNIAAAFTTVGGAVVGRARSVAQRAVSSGQPISISSLSRLNEAIRFQRGMLFMDIGTNVGNALLIGYDTYLQLRDADAATGDSTLADYQRIYGVEEGRRRWEVERVTRILGVLARAAVNGGLALVALRGASKSLSESEKALEELSRLTNPGSSWGLAMSYRQSDQAAQSRPPGSTDADLPRVIINPPGAAGEAASHTQIDRSKVLEMRHPESSAESSRLILDPAAVEEAVMRVKSGQVAPRGLPESSRAEAPKIVLYRGTIYDFIQGAHTGIDDLGNGLYWSREFGLALLYGQERRSQVQDKTPGVPGIVIKVEVAQSELGRVLDFYFDKNLRNDWEEYLRNRESGDVVLSGGPAEMYYGHFVNWVYGKGMRLSDFDTIIGPEYIRGGSQICIRNKAIAERLIKHAEEVARAHEPLGPAYPDPGSNGRLDLVNKLKP